MTAVADGDTVYCKLCRKYVDPKDYGTVYCFECEMDLEDELLDE